MATTLCQSSVRLAFRLAASGAIVRSMGLEPGYPVVIGTGSQPVTVYDGSFQPIDSFPGDGYHVNITCQKTGPDGVEYFRLLSSEWEGNTTNPGLRGGFVRADHQQPLGDDASLRQSQRLPQEVCCRCDVRRCARRSRGCDRAPSIQARRLARLRTDHATKSSDVVSHLQRLKRTQDHRL